MDRSFSNSVLGFMGSAVVVGTITNFVVTVSFSGGDFINAILICSSNDCTPHNIFWGTIFLAVFSYVSAFTFDFVRWINIIKKINIYAPEYSFDKLEIVIENQTKANLLNLNIRPRFNKEKTFYSRLNVTRELDNKNFEIKHESIRGETKVKEILAESSLYNDKKYPFTRFFIGDTGYFRGDYFPFDVYDESSSDSEKSKGSLWIAIFEIVIELEGSIGAGKISKLFYGKFSHSVTIYEYEKKKYRKSYRWIKCSPKYVSNMQWLEFKEINLKKLRKIIEENQVREKNANGGAEIQTKEDLIKELQEEEIIV